MTCWIVFISILLLLICLMSIRCEGFVDTAALKNAPPTLHPGSTAIPIPLPAYPHRSPPATTMSLHPPLNPPQRDSPMSSTTLL